jgi:zinc transporter ZupT
LLTIFSFLFFTYFVVAGTKRQKKITQRRSTTMDISRQLGILIFCGVPAIVGGGIVYAIFGSYAAVCVYEILLLFVAGGIVRK